MSANFNEEDDEAWLYGADAKEPDDTQVTMPQKLLAFLLTKLFFV